jgi:hypothetical protein
MHQVLHVIVVRRMFRNIIIVSLKPTQISLCLETKEGAYFLVPSSSILIVPEKRKVNIVGRFLQLMSKVLNGNFEIIEIDCERRLTFTLDMLYATGPSRGRKF